MEDKSRSFICPHCEQPAIARRNGEAAMVPTDERDPGFAIIYHLEQCAQCQGVSLFAYEEYGHGDSPIGPDLIYPAPRGLSTKIPNSLRHAYAEAVTCFGARAYTATAVMVRRTLEGACQELGMRREPLFKSLEKLKEQNQIDETLSKWATELRTLGNQGAHFSEYTISREDAEDSLAFTEAFLDHIFVFRQRFDEFQKRRRNSPTS